MIKVQNGIRSDDQDSASGTSLTVSREVVWTTTLVTGWSFGRWTSVERTESLLLLATETTSTGTTAVGVTVSGNVTELTTVVALGTLRLLITVGLDVADTTTVETLLRSVLSWFWTFRRFVTSGTTVVT
ncbi:hypothetical protein WICPIJ_000188 [Wickerhamomyces pijperi]|uniref:Uncharacterized protein n=1 Tax=Wickerhamomyces pijperi TaxID=599730 RepID=A0A9P8QEB2_WICPI|nr:hypothetical protein WICPIJ_000188 [Wickerhamomyces pijperi]